MKMIVLTGLVSIEKAQLAADMAHYISTQGQSVQVIDNIARQALTKIVTDVQHVTRIEGDNLNNLIDSLASVSADVVIVAVTEQAHPEKLFVALDNLQEQFDTWEIYTIALIDTRTCDCFPNVRQALELYADVSLMLPYDLDQVLNYVAIA